MEDISLTFIKSETFSFNNNIDKINSLLDYLNNNNIVSNIKNTYTNYNDLSEVSQNEFNSLMNEIIKNDVKKVIYDYEKNIQENTE